MVRFWVLWFDRRPRRSRPVCLQRSAWCVTGKGGRSSSFSGGRWAFLFGRCAVFVFRYSRSSSFPASRLAISECGCGQFCGLWWCFVCPRLPFMLLGLRLCARQCGHGKNDELDTTKTEIKAGNLAWSIQMPCAASSHSSRLVGEEGSSSMSTSFLTLLPYTQEESLNGSSTKHAL